MPPISTSRRPRRWASPGSPTLAPGVLRSVDFKTWLSITWADIVAHPDPEQRRRHRAAGTGVDYAEGIKLTDPRRMAVYFAKYGTGGRKDYQHRVPPEWLSVALVCDDCGAEYDAECDECPDCGSLDAELVETGAGPGRFWGYRGLTPVLATRQVSPDTGIAAGRVLRRWYRAKGLTKTVLVERVEQTTGRVRSRRTRKRRRLFAHGRGFACVNDGPAFASQLARHLDSRGSPLGGPAMTLTCELSHSQGQAASSRPIDPDGVREDRGRVRDVSRPALVLLSKLSSCGGIWA